MRQNDMGTVQFLGAVKVDVFAKVLHGTHYPFRKHGLLHVSSVERLSHER